MNCQVCDAAVPQGAAFCPACGAPLAHEPAIPGFGYPRCATCGRTSPAGSGYCVSCGRRFPYSAAQAQDAAAEAAQVASSSGLRTPLEKELAERAAVIAEMDRFALERSVPPPPPTGRGDVADAAQAEDHFDRVHRAWEEADTDWRSAHATLGLLPDAAALAEVEHLDRRREAAWRSRCSAMAHRDRLLAALDDVGGANLPPGGSWWS